MITEREGERVTEMKLQRMILTDSCSSRTRGIELLMVPYDLPGENEDGFGYVTLLDIWAVI